MLKKWPEYCEEYLFDEDEKRMQGIMEIIRTIRNLRAEMNVAPSKRTHLKIAANEGWNDVLAAGEGYFKRLAGVSELALITDRSTITEKTVNAVTTAGELFIPLGELVDFAAEIARLQKELDNLHKEADRARGKLSNEGFIAKAPANLVQQEKDKLEANLQKSAAIENRIAELKESL